MTQIVRQAMHGKGGEVKNLHTRIHFDTDCVSKSLQFLVCKILLTQHLRQNESEESSGTQLDVSHSTSLCDYFLALMVPLINS